MDSVRGHNKGRGKFRTTQNWIGKEGTPIEQAVFVPPSPLGLQDHLNRWEAYWHADAPDALVQPGPDPFPVRRAAAGFHV